MSREQARSIIKTLQGALDRSEPRRLPPSVTSSTPDNSHNEQAGQADSGDASVTKD
jgi:hypothetical protein